MSPSSLPLAPAWAQEGEVPAGENPSRVTPGPGSRGTGPPWGVRWERGSGPWRLPAFCGQEPRALWCLQAAVIHSHAGGLHNPGPPLPSPLRWDLSLLILSLAGHPPPPRQPGPLSRGDLVASSPPLCCPLGLDLGAGGLSRGGTPGGDPIPSVPFPGAALFLFGLLGRRRGRGGAGPRDLSVLIPKRKQFRTGFGGV